MKKTLVSLALAALATTAIATPKTDYVTLQNGGISDVLSYEAKGDTFTFSLSPLTFDGVLDHELVSWISIGTGKLFDVSGMYSRSNFDGGNVSFTDSGFTVFFDTFNQSRPGLDKKNAYFDESISFKIDLDKNANNKRANIFLDTATVGLASGQVLSAVTPVPEPGSLSMMAAGLLVIGGVMRKRNNA